MATMAWQLPREDSEVSHAGAGGVVAAVWGVRPKGAVVKEKAAPYCVRWVRRFLTRPASDEPLADQVRRFCEDLERDGAYQDWQVRQAEHALRIYLVNFLHRTDWNRRPISAVVDEQGRTNPLAALEQLRARIR